MKSQKDFLENIVKIFESADIDYMIAGSVASSFHGRPRATQDVDIVIQASQRQMLRFLKLLGKDYYVSLQAAGQAIKNHTTFNVIDIIDGHKADIIILKDRPFSIEEFRRKKDAKMMSVRVKVASPEDVILSKLEWSKESGSEKQFDDALGVAIIQWNSLDLEYLHKWSIVLKIESLLQRLLDGVKKQRT
jgi:hypothetical protein